MPRRYSTRRHMLTFHRLARGNTLYRPYGKYFIARIDYLWDCGVGYSVSGLENQYVYSLIVPSPLQVVNCMPSCPDLKDAIRDHVRYLRAVAVETIPEAFGTLI